MRPLAEVLHARVRSREEQAFVAVIAPTHDVRRTPFLSVNFQNLGVPVGFADMMALDHDPITDTRSHPSSHTFCLLGRATAKGHGERHETHLPFNRRDVPVVAPGA